MAPPAFRGQAVGVPRTWRMLRSGCGGPGARAPWAPPGGQAAEAQTPRQLSPCAVWASLLSWEDIPREPSRVGEFLSTGEELTFSSTACSRLPDTPAGDATLFLRLLGSGKSSKDLGIFKIPKLF